MVPTSCQLFQAHGGLGEHWRRVPQNGPEKQRDRLWSSRITQPAGGARGFKFVGGVLLGPKHQLTQAPNLLLDVRIHTQRGNGITALIWGGTRARRGEAEEGRWRGPQRMP